jgi:GNAT superfamily N-acetyltransferase
MKFREATVEDITVLHVIRMAVKENVLNNPMLVTTADYERYLTTDGRGWLCEIGGRIAGFGIIDTSENNIWALFVHPDHEGKGIGKEIQKLMLDWHFSNSKDTLWLGTSPSTRAESFYRSSGWKDMGLRKNGEIRFEMSITDWEGI